jgi:hypothetical protein
MLLAFALFAKYALPLTPAEDVEQKQTARRLKSVGDETMEIVTLTEHPKEVGSRQVDFCKAQELTPSLKVLEVGFRRV